MEPCYFGSDAWKNHSSYDNRYPDDHPYNQKAWDIGHQEDEPETKKENNKGFQPYSSDDDDFGVYDLADIALFADIGCKR